MNIKARYFAVEPQKEENKHSRHPALPIHHAFCLLLGAYVFAWMGRPNGVKKERDEWTMVLLVLQHKIFKLVQLCNQYTSCLVQDGLPRNIMNNAS